MQLQYGAFSHQGKVRKSNEDCYFIPARDHALSNLFMVADGMGGHNAGDIASKMVVESILNYFAEKEQDIDQAKDIRDFIVESIEQANEKVYTSSVTESQLSGMGTTLTLAYFHQGKVCIGHVGDSRGYWIGKEGIKQITKDHSLVQELLENGSISPDELSSHPQKNIITRALGTEKTVKVDYYEISVSENDRILLCTDGLTNHVDLNSNLELLTSDLSPDKIAEILGKQALDSGGFDNITVVIIQYSGMVEKR